MVKDENLDLQVLHAGNFDKICRLCLSYSKELRVFHKLYYEGVLIADVIKEVTSLQIPLTDELPSHICHGCIGQLVQSYIFIRKCHSSNNILQQLLENFEVKLEIEDTESNKLSDENVEIQFADDLKSCDKIKSKSNDQSKDGLNTQISYGKGVTLETEVSKPDFTEKPTSNIEKSPVSLYECGNCNKKHNSLEELQKHLKQIVRCSSGSDRFCCSFCNRKFKNRYRLGEHLRTHTKEKPYKCNLCPAIFTQNQNLLRHQKSHTGEKSFLCEHCGKGFTRSVSKKEHIMKFHAGEKTLNCDSCNKQFFWSSDLNRHNQKYHNADDTVTTSKPDFQCNYCSKSYSSLNYLINHQTIGHDGENPRSENSAEKSKCVCEICGKFLASELTLKTHYMVKHSNIKPYKCLTCDKAFAYKPALSVHMKIHRDKTLENNSDSKYLCYNCGKTFTTKMSLKIHMVVHTNIKPYSCTMCDKTFSYYSGLSAHKRTHNGEKPYCCKICQRTFTQNGHLIQHSKIHTGEKPHSCDFCGKHFAMKFNLVVHRRMHTGETPYCCKHCTKGYADSSSLKKHVRINHPQM